MDNIMSMTDQQVRDLNRQLTKKLAATIVVRVALGVLGVVVTTLVDKKLN